MAGAGPGTGIGAGAGGGGAIGAAAHAAGFDGAGDLVVHNLTFGAGNIALHEMTAWLDLGRPHRAVTQAERLARAPLPGLAPTRLGHLHIDSARAQLAVGNRDEAVACLQRARETAPQMARVHPQAREVLRVLVSLHQRANPALSSLARWAGAQDGPER